MDKNIPVIQRRSSGPKPPSFREKVAKKMSSMKQNLKTTIPKPQIGSIQTTLPLPRFRGRETPAPEGSLSTVRSKLLPPREEPLLWYQLVPTEGRSYLNQKFLRLLSNFPHKFCWRIVNGADNKIRFFCGVPTATALSVQKILQTSFDEVEISPHSDMGHSLSDRAKTATVIRIGPRGLGFNPKAERVLEDLLVNLEGNPCLVEIRFQKAEAPSSLAPPTPAIPSSAQEDENESMWDLRKLLSNDGSKKAPKKPASPSREVVAPPPPSPPDTRLYFSVEIVVRAEGELATSTIQSIVTILDTSLRDAHRLVLESQTKDHPETKLWIESELLPLLNLPNMQHRSSKRVLSVKSGQRQLREDEMNEGIAVGRMIHPLQQDRLVYIAHKVLLKHFFMSGKNGSGKSSTIIMILQSLIDQWLENPSLHPGFTFLDPAQASLTIVLNRLRHAEQQGKHVPWEKVHYFRLGSGSDYPIGLNLFHRLPTESIHNVQQTVRNLLSYAYGGQTARMDKYLRFAAHTLLSDDTRDHNIMGIIPILQNEKLSRSIYVDDPVVKAFWDGGGKPRDEDFDVLQTRLDPLIGNPEMRNIFGRSDWTPRIRDWMDEGHICLFDMKGLSESDVKLTAGHLTNRYFAEALQRPEERSKFHFFLFEECHQAQVPALPTMLAMIRKHGVSTGLITQYPHQLDKDLLLAISENIGTIFACTQGENSSKKVESMMNGKFSAETLQDLGERIVATYTQGKDDAGKNVTKTFTIESDPPVIYMPNGKPANHLNPDETEEAQRWAQEKARELMQRDCKHRDQVQSEIADYLSSLS